jgi:hypothetical protein
MISLEFQFWDAHFNFVNGYLVSEIPSFVKHEVRRLTIIKLGICSME